MVGLNFFFYARTKNLPEMARGRSWRGRFKGQEGGNFVQAWTESESNAGFDGLRVSKVHNKRKPDEMGF